MTTNNLTLLRQSLILGFPKHTRRSNRHSSLPKTGKSIAAQSAIIFAPAGSVSGGRFDIGRVATSRTREGWQSRVDWGELSPCLFLFPKPHEVPHV